MATMINSFKSVTGVSATASGDGVVLKSTEFGSSQFVSVHVVDDAGQSGGLAMLSATDNNAATTDGFVALNAATNPVRDEGQDIGAIVNGVTANAEGKRIQMSTEFLDVELELTDAGSQALGSFNALTVTGGGARFNLGPTVDIGNQVSIGIGNVASRRLGSLTNGYLSSLAAGQDNNVVNGNVGDAQKVVNDAITQISSMRGRLGAIQKNVIGGTIRSLGVALENVSAAESAIRDTDFATETAELTRAQILVAAATNVIGIANAQPQNVLNLIG